jgi:cold shock CspA family protein
MDRAVTLRTGQRNEYEMDRAVTLKAGQRNECEIWERKAEGIVPLDSENYTKIL